MGTGPNPDLAGLASLLAQGSSMNRTRSGDILLLANWGRLARRES